jgi:hypothetical protein
VAHIDLKDESFSVVIQKTGAEPVTVAVDLLETRLMFEDMEKRFPLERRDGLVYASRDFLRAAANELKEMGVTDATPTMAFQLWSRLGEVAEAVKKNTNEGSESDGSTG